MFKRLLNEFTWESRFDRAFRFSREYVLYKIMCQRLEEKIYYWKVWGRKFRHTPEESLDKAVSEFCEEFRHSNTDKTRVTEELNWMAHAMMRMKEHKFENGKLVLSRDQLSEFWQGYLKSDL